MSYSQTSSSNTDNLDPDFAAEVKAPEPETSAPPPAGDQLVDLLRRFGNVRLELSCDVGEAPMKLNSLLALEKGSVVAIERPVGEDLGLRLNGVSFGRADVMIVDSRVLLRVTEIGSNE